MRFDPLAFLRDAGLLSGGEACREPLAGGYWNAVWRVRAGADDLVVKHFGRTAVASSLFPIAPQVEARALELLRGRDIAPDPVGFWPASGGRGAVLVYRFVPGAMWCGEVAEAAALLRKVHAVAADGFRVMPVMPQEVLDHADGLPAPPADDPAWLRLQAARPRPAAVPPLGRRAFIHADFSAGNMIAGPHGARCIDWQCPGLGDAAEDLWSFLAPAFQIVYDREPWSAKEVGRFRGAYGDPAVLDRLDAMGPYFSWRFARYCVFRVHQLAGVDAAGSERYRRAAAAETAWLERYPAP